VGQPLRIGELAHGHRERIRQILDATRVFRSEEVDVAVELFDDAFPPEVARSTGAQAPTCSPSAGDSTSAPRTTGHRPPATGSDYAFLGAFTAEDDLVGYACFGPTPDTDRTFDLYWIAVDPGAQGAGSGTALLGAVERRLEGQNARMLIVETSSRSEYAPTRRFYEKRGYAEAARVREFYAPDDDRIIFTKRFHSPARRGAVQQ
jgi:GNAT superfamily N-acetyltransferase